MTQADAAAQGGVVAAMRLRQWPKNLLLYVGIALSTQVDDPERWIQATAAFVAYCLASSAAYIFNDVRDADDDRRHPIKRHRPIASGRLRSERALNIAGILVALAFAIVAPLGWGSLAYLAGFVVLEFGYSVGLKAISLLAVIVIAGLLVIRVGAGAEAVDVRLPFWLMVCIALLALAFALARRPGRIPVG